MRAERSGRPHLVGQHQADPRWASLPGAPRLPARAPLPARARGASAQRPAHHLADALRAAAPRRAAPLVDDPAGPLSIRPPRRARPAAAVREHRPRPARERARVAGPLPPGLRVLGLLGAGLATGGAERPAMPMRGVRRSGPEPRASRSRPTDRAGRRHLSIGYQENASPSRREASSTRAVPGSAESARSRAAPARGRE